MKERREKDVSKSDSYNIPKSINIGVTINTTGVTLRVNDKLVYSCVNKTLTLNTMTLKFHAGIHLVTLHQATGQVMRTENFMTWQAGTECHLLSALESIQDGRLLVFIGMPNFISHLTSKSLDVLSNLGSWFVRSLAVNEMWCFAVYKSGHVVLESTNIDSVYNNTQLPDVGPFNLEFAITPMQGQRCAWYSDLGMKERAEFCEEYEGYGDFCSCRDTPWNPKPSKVVSIIRTVLK
ncbi:hypothetical protein SK128_016407 [Halocaridina rubra]|uniref:ILEI/PANDER domain-containing protein n=1 Tax=Halocaridina rubra TaxID=373956 RepID=A0AAN8XBJ9_HALRR